MKRGLVVSLTALTVWTGLTLAQTGKPGGIFVTAEPAPPPSVIRLDPSATVKPRPPVQKSKPVQPASFEQDVPTVESFKPELPKSVVPAPVVEKADMLPLPTLESGMPPISTIGHHDESSYSTDLISSPFPWTKCGKRVCGTVYVETPYVWFDARYLFGWYKKDRSPPLATTGPVGAAMPGALDDPQTTVLFTGDHLHDLPHMGGAFNAGGWFDECQYCGGEFNYFFFASQDHGFISTANGFPGTPGLYIPFFNPLTGSEDAFAVSNQNNIVGPVDGSLRINARSRLHGADGHLLFSFTRGMSYRCDAIAGVRWLLLDEDLTIEENVKLKARPNILPSDVGIFDRFETRNDFIGADFGFKSHFEKGCWSCDILTRVAVGGTHQTFRGIGETTVTFPFFPLQVTQPGRLIGPANLGVCTNDIFSVVPEVGFSIAYQPVRWCKFTMGYNYVYWTNVIRPGGQVDRVINPIGVPTRPEFNSDIYEPRRPGVGFNETDIWLQSVTLGMQLSF